MKYFVRTIKRILSALQIDEHLFASTSSEDINSRRSTPIVRAKSCNLNDMPIAFHCAGNGRLLQRLSSFEDKKVDIPEATLLIIAASHINS